VPTVNYDDLATGTAVGSSHLPQDHQAERSRCNVLGKSLASSAIFGDCGGCQAEIPDLAPFSPLLTVLLIVGLAAGVNPAQAAYEVTLDDLVITGDDNVVLQWNAAALAGDSRHGARSAGGGAGLGDHAQRDGRCLGGI
jgi:hypothetical protein